MKTRLYSILKFAVGWPLTILAFLFIGKIIYDQAPSLQPHIASLNPILLFYGTVSFIVYYFLRSYIWYRIIQGFSHKIPFKDTNYLWAMSELKRYVPGNVWSFLGRTVLFNRRGVEKKDIGKGLIIEAELFVIGSVIVSLLALPFLLPGYNKLIGWAAVIFVCLGIAVFVFNSAIMKKARQSRVVKFLFPALPPAEILLQIVLSTAALFFFGLGTYFVISAAFILDPQLVPVLIGVFVLAFVAGYLSIVTPAGFGVREGIVIVALSKLLPQAGAAFAALFSRFVLIIAELLFIGISYLWYKQQSRFVTRITKWLTAHPHEAVIIALCLLYTIYFTTVSFLRYDNFFAGRFDLGNMAQTVWNTSQGRIFQFTDPDSTGEVSRLAYHADFLLILLAPFYWIWPDPRMLLLIQTVVVAAGAYFLYLITQKVLNHKVLGIVLAFAYLINPSLQRANIYDFHAATLVTTFLLGTFYFYITKRYKWFIVFALLAAICKEQIWAILAIFGIFLMVHQKKWLFGAAMFFISAGMFYFLVSYAIPHASPKVTHFALDYYSDFGDSPAQVIKTVVLSPDKVVALVMEKEHQEYLEQLFSPVGYLSYLAPWMLIFAGPDLLINLLSKNSQLHQIYYQYTAAITPFIFIAAVYGIWLLKVVALRGSRNIRLPRSLQALGLSVLIVYVLYNAVMGAYRFGPLPGSQEPNLAVFTRQEKNRELIDKTLAALPSDKSVAASNNIGSHLSNRQHLYVLPVGADQADILVFLLTESERGPSFAAEQEQLKKFSKDPRYKVVVQKDEFTVLERK